MLGYHMRLLFTHSSQVASFSKIYLDAKWGQRCPVFFQYPMPPSPFEKQNGFAHRVFLPTKGVKSHLFLSNQQPCLLEMNRAHFSFWVTDVLVCKWRLRFRLVLQKRKIHSPGALWSSRDMKNNTKWRLLFVLHVAFRGGKTNPLGYF